MKTSATFPRRFEFSFPYQDTLILVEETEDRLVIRATRNTFTEAAKMRFIRGLADEGFVSESYRHLNRCSVDPSEPVQWVIDYSWLTLSPAKAASARKFMVGSLVCASVLWVVMIAIVAFR